MSKKRIILVTALLLLILATAAFFASSLMKKSSPETMEKKTGLETVAPSEDNDGQMTENVLAPLPTDNKQAIDAEIQNIDAEINSAIETDLGELEGIEECL